MARTARVVTNETCNLACAFCTFRRPVERAEVAAADRVLERIDAARAAEIVLTGGEPTLRRDLPLFVARAAGGGRRVVLETNGALVDAARARALARAGLSVARVHVPGWGADADAVTRDPGAFERTLAAMRALDAAGVAVEAAAPVVASTLAGLPSLPAKLGETPARALWLSVPTSSPDPAELVAIADAARVVAAVADAGRRVGLAVRLDPGAPLPPCAFERPARVAHLFALTPGGAERPDHRHLDACARCAAVDRCPGVPAAAIARGDPFAPTPFQDDRLRRRLSIVSTAEEQIARELVTEELRRYPDGTSSPERVVRVVFQCNQACRFCFVSTHLPAAADAAVEAAIVETAREHGVVTLSGGEPTLHPRLVELVALARREGAREIELQTNAIRLGDPARVAALVDAGVGTFFVSLHAATAAISDAITDAPGTFDATLRGLDALHAHGGARVRVNFVLCADNLAELAGVVELVAARWPTAELNVSFVAPSTDVVPREIVPRYADAMPFVAAALRRARERGVSVVGFASMCGVPLCLVPDDVAPFFQLAEAPPDGGEFVKSAACASCALSTRCFGVRRGYAELHGTSELTSIP